MSTPSSAQVYTQGFGSKPLLGKIVSTVNPGTTYSPGWAIGQEWVNTSTNTVYFLTSISTSAGVTTPTWTLLESGSSSFLTLTGDTGTATPSAGNVKIAGTANEITTAGSGATVTLTIPPIFTAPGSITAAAGNITVSTSGDGLVLPVVTGSGAASGSVTCNGRVGSVSFTSPSIAATASTTLIVSNTSVTGSSTVVLYSMRGVTTGAAIGISSVTNSASTSTVVVTNGQGAVTQTNTITLDFIVLN